MQHAACIKPARNLHHVAKMPATCNKITVIMRHAVHVVPHATNYWHHAACCARCTSLTPCHYKWPAWPLRSVSISVSGNSCGALLGIPLVQGRCNSCHGLGGADARSRHGNHAARHSHNSLNTRRAPHKLGIPPVTPSIRRNRTATLYCRRVHFMSWPPFNECALLAQ